MSILQLPGTGDVEILCVTLYIRKLLSCSEQLEIKTVLENTGLANHISNCFALLAHYDLCDQTQSDFQVILHLAIEATWILTNVFFVSEAVVFHFLIVESENCMDENYEPGASPIFRMLDSMLRSQSHFLIELTLHAVFNAICESETLGSMLFS